MNESTYEREIRTTPSMKKAWQACFQQFWNITGFERWEHMRDLATMLLSNPEINNLKEKLGSTKYDELIKKMNEFNDRIAIAKQIREYLRVNLEAERKKGQADEVIKKIKEELNKGLEAVRVVIPAMQPEIVWVVMTLAERTDLKRVSINLGAPGFPERNQYRVNPVHSINS